MTDDATLTDFLEGDEVESADEDEAKRDGKSEDEATGDGQSEDEATGDGQSEDEPGDQGESDDSSLEPVTSTYGWGEYSCMACGDATSRVWHDDGRDVCPACKSW